MRHHAPTLRLCLLSIGGMISFGTWQMQTKSIWFRVVVAPECFSLFACLAFCDIPLVSMFRHLNTISEGDSFLSQRAF